MGLDEWIDKDINYIVYNSYGQNASDFYKILNDPKINHLFVFMLIIRILK